MTKSQEYQVGSSRLFYQAVAGSNKLKAFDGELSQRLYGLSLALLADLPGQILVAQVGQESNYFLALCRLISEVSGRDLTYSQSDAQGQITADGQVLLAFALTETKKSQVNPPAQLQKLLIATHNAGKTKEFARLFGALGIEVEDLSAYPDLPEVAETGMTFEENARLKAETIADLTGQMVLADDSGLSVDVLGGLPGVWSARFAGADASDQDNMAKLLHELASVIDRDRRRAHFHTTLVVAKSGCDSLVVEADWPGYIAFEPKGDQGFGYDPIFLVGETSQTSAQLNPEEKNEQSHRGQAVKRLMEVFPAWQAKHF